MNSKSDHSDCHISSGTHCNRHTHNKVGEHCADNDDHHEAPTTDMTKKQHHWQLRRTVHKPDCKRNAFVSASARYGKLTRLQAHVATC